MASYNLDEILRRNDGTWLPAPGDLVSLGGAQLSMAWPPDVRADWQDIDWRTPFLVVSVTPRELTDLDGNTRMYDVIIFQNDRLGWFKRRVAGVEVSAGR